MNIYKELKDILFESERLNNHKTIDKIANLTIRLSQVDDVRVLNQISPENELEILRNENFNLKNEISLVYRALQEKGVDLQDLAATVSTMKQIPKGYDISPSENLAGATKFIAPQGVIPITGFKNNMPFNELTVDLNTNLTTQQ